MNSASGSIISVSGSVSAGAGLNFFGNSDVQTLDNLTSGWDAMSFGKGSLRIGRNAAFQGNYAKGNGGVTVALTLTVSGYPRMGTGARRFSALTLGGANSTVQTNVTCRGFPTSSRVSILQNFDSVMGGLVPAVPAQVTAESCFPKMS